MLSPNPHPHKAFQVMILADDIVVSTKVEDDFRTLQGKETAGRYRSPKVFANLHAKGEGACLEENGFLQSHLLSA